MDKCSKSFIPLRSPGCCLSDEDRLRYGGIGVQPIPADDLAATVAAMIEHAAYHLPEDWVRALRFGHDREEDPVGRDIYKQLMYNAMAASEARRPTCQDTGQAVIFIEIGQDVHIIGGSLHEAIQRGVAQGYRTLRASIVRDALFDRRNTQNNTPAVVHLEIVRGRRMAIHLAEKGFGSENKCFMTMYRYPNEGEAAVLAYVLSMVEKSGAGWCPPGMLSIAVGGNFELAPKLAKRALYEPFDMDLLLQKESADPAGVTENERLRIKLFNEINRIGIGPQGLGGTSTVLDVKLTTAPTHIAGLPIAVNVQCNKAHHLSAELDGSGPVTEFPTPDFAAYIGGLGVPSTTARKLSVPMSRADVESLVAGEPLLLTGTLLTGRDAAHKRMIETMNRGQPLPVELRDQFIYYVGPVPAQPGEIIGPAGPTTGFRMDLYTPPLLRAAGLAGTIGKAERSPELVQVISETKTVYLIATGGAAYLQARAITGVKVLAYHDLGPEAIHELEVRDFPVIVAVDSRGNNIHETGRLRNQQMKTERNGRS